MLKTKRTPASLPELADVNQIQEAMEGTGRDDDWVTEDSPESANVTSLVAGYAELSADTMLVQTHSNGHRKSLQRSSSVPKRWASMMNAMPHTMKYGIDMVRKASVRTVRSHRSNTSIIEPLNSTRLNAQVQQRLGPVPQLAPPEFGPPLTSSDLDLTFRLPYRTSMSRPQLREAQSFLTDVGSACPQPSSTGKRFDLHSLRSGFSKSSAVLDIRQQQQTARDGTCGLKPSHSCQAKGRLSSELPRSSAPNANPTPDAHRKRKMMDKVRDWWKRQCMQKTLSGLRKKNVKAVQSGTTFM
jgi:hypothetical protein